MKKLVPKLPDLPQKINWFPGHMHKALRQLQQRTADVDVFLEIRDARLPYSTRNPEFDMVIKKAQKKKVIIFNKFDLCDQKATGKIIEDYRKLGLLCYPVSAKTHINMKEMVAWLKSTIPPKYKTVGTWMMVCGMPNVGKSTIINQLRTISDLENKAATSKATATVCTTKALTGVRINQNPLMYLVDSPGVMIPSNISDDIGLKLGCLGMLRDLAVDKQHLVEYLIEMFQSQNNPKYYTAFKLTKPQTPMDYLLKVRIRYGLHNYDAAWDHILETLRNGEMGQITLDVPQQH